MFWRGYGTTQVDLKYIFNTTLSNISLSGIVFFAGILVGAAFGFTFKWLNRQITLTILTVIAAVGFIMVPWCEALWGLYLCTFAMGLGHGLSASSTNTWIIEMFKDKSGPPLQIKGLTLAIAGIFGPLLFRPFLTGEVHAVANTTLSANTTQSSIALVTADTRRARLTTPFVIMAIIIFVGAVIFLALFLIRKYKYDPPQIQTVTGMVDKKRDKNAGWIGKLNIVLCVCLITFHSTSRDINSQFTNTFLQNIPNPLTAQMAANFQLYMATAQTVNLLFNMFINMHVGARYMLAYQYPIMFIGLFLVYYNSSFVMLLIGCLVMGAGFESVYWVIVSFISEQVTVNNIVGTLLIFIGRAPMLFLPFIIGTMIEKQPFCEIYLFAVNLFFCFLFTLLILGLERIRLNREKLEDNEKGINLQQIDSRV